jgi:hypothetical protein
MADEHAQVLIPHAEYIGIYKLRMLTKGSLRELRNDLIVIAPGDKEPSAVIVPYRNYIRMQEMLASLG